MIPPDRVTMAAIDTEDLARTVLVALIPHRRYRTAGRNDERFASFAPLCQRIAFQHLGAHPSLLLFCGPDHDPREAARRAASWAGANWTPSAIQRQVLPGVVAVHVAPHSRLARPGWVEDAAVPSAVWTVDADSGHVEAPAGPQGGPPARAVERAARHLATGGAPATFGELDYAERGIMQVHRRSTTVARAPGVAGLLLMLLGFRFAYTVFGDVMGGRWLTLPRDLVLLAGIVGAVALVFDYGGIRGRLPGFSSTRRWVPALTWVGYIAVVVIVAGLLGLLIPRGPRA
jgi:hypothetical protein